MSNDDQPRALYPLPFPIKPLASIVAPPAALASPPEQPPELEHQPVLPLGTDPGEQESESAESVESFEIPGASPVLTGAAPAPIFEPSGPPDEGQAAPAAAGTPAAGAAPAPPPPSAPRPGWLLPDLMRTRETHMLSGSSGAGKTTWLGWFIAQLLNADTVFDRTIQRPPFVAYIAGDRALDDAREKFIRAGWEEPNTWGIVEASGEVETHLKGIVHGNGNEEQTFPILRVALRAIARKHKFPSDALPHDSLIILDSMATILGIEPSGSYLKNVAAPMALLNRYCQQAKITIILVHHGGKQMADKTQRYARAQDRILGSMALLGFTSTQIQLTEPELTSHPEDGVHEVTVVSHSAKAFAMGFTREPETGAFVPLVGSLPSPENREDPTTLAADLALRGALPPQGRIEPRPTRLAKSHEGILSALRVDAADAKLSGLEGRWCQTTALRAHLESLCSKAAFYKALEKLGTIGMIEAKLEDGIAWIRLSQEKQAS